MLPPAAPSAPSAQPQAPEAEVPLFRAPERDSVWERVIFKPLYDPFDVMRSAFYVRTKAATVVPFRPFRTQKLYVDRLGLRNVVVKPRQVGSSTVNLGLMTANAVTTPNINTLIVTHRDDTTASMRQTIKMFIDWLNEHYGFGIEIGADNENQLHIKSMDSWFFFATAGGKGAGRSRTIQQLLCSEMAHWDIPDPGAEFGGMLESVPDNGFVVVESTPNGAEGPFYDYYNAEDTQWVKHFFPWFLEPSRRIPLNGRELHLTDEEQALRLTATMYGVPELTHEQIAWRRAKMREMAAARLDFLQEYPEDDITCFTAGVRAYFPAARMNMFLRQAQAAVYQSEPVKGDPWDPGGELRTFEPPRSGERYIVYGDVGGGHKDGDESVAVVYRPDTMQTCAVLAGHWKPQKFADLTIDLLAKPYNEALLGHEANGIGDAAVEQAVYRRKYKNYYWEHRNTQTRDGVLEEWKPGLYVVSNQRTQLLNLILEQVVNGTFHCPDLRLVRQLTAARLERVRSGGSWRDAVQFPKSVHDDYAMAYAGALELARQSAYTRAHRPAAYSGI